MSNNRNDVPGAIAHALLMSTDWSMDAARAALERALDAQLDIEPERNPPKIQLPPDMDYQEHDMR